MNAFASRRCSLSWVSARRGSPKRPAKIMAVLGSPLSFLPACCVQSSCCSCRKPPTLVCRPGSEACCASPALAAADQLSRRFPTAAGLPAEVADGRFSPNIANDMVAVGLSWVLSFLPACCVQSSCCRCRKPPPLSADCRPASQPCCTGTALAAVDQFCERLATTSGLPSEVADGRFRQNSDDKQVSQTMCVQSRSGARACKIASSDISGRMPASQPDTALYGTCLKLNAINVHVMLRTPCPPAWLQLSFPGSSLDAVRLQCRPASQACCTSTALAVAGEVCGPFATSLVSQQRLPMAASGQIVTITSLADHVRAEQISECEPAT